MDEKALKARRPKKRSITLMGVNTGKKVGIGFLWEGEEQEDEREGFQRWSFERLRPLSAIR